MKCKSSTLIFIFITIYQVSSIRVFESIKCQFYECCREPYLLKNYDLLDKTLGTNLFGQPLVKRTLISAIKAHLELKDPSKALTLSFHGSTGVGKTFVSHTVAQSLFKKGVKSNFFKVFVANKDFPHNEKINEYKEKIQKEIEETVRKCERSLFIFDETDKIPVGLLDAIKAFIDFNHEINGVDYRKSIFIFLSNAGAKQIVELTLNLDKQNLNRDNFEMKQFQGVIQTAAYGNKDEENKGLWRASIIDSYLIDYYIPFLPLERIHVKKCIRAELKRYKFADENYFRLDKMEEDVDAIANEMIYEPPGISKYSTSGCKRVPNLVRNLIMEKKYNLKDEL